MSIYDELWNDPCIDLLESVDIIMERSDRKDSKKFLPGYIERLFEHLIKYQYNPRKQTKSWIETIVTKHKEILDCGNDLIRYVDDQFLNTCYKKGYSDAVKESKNNVTRETPKDRPYDWNITFITNIELIREYLHTYYSYENVYPFDLDKTIDYHLYNSSK